MQLSSSVWYTLRDLSTNSMGNEFIKQQWINDEVNVNCCVHCMIMNDSEQNHSMGSPIDQTPPWSEDLIEIIRWKTICAVAFRRPLKWQRERKVVPRRVELWPRLSLIWQSLSGLQTVGESRPSDSPCCEFAHYLSRSSSVYSNQHSFHH